MSWFVYVVKFARILTAPSWRMPCRRVASRCALISPHPSPAFHGGMVWLSPGDFPVTEDLGMRGLAIPFSSVMTEGWSSRFAGPSGW